MIKSLWRLLLPIKTQALHFGVNGTPQDEPGKTSRDTDLALKSSRDEAGGACERVTAPSAVQAVEYCRGSSAVTEHSAPTPHDCGSNACRCKETTAESHLPGHENRTSERPSSGKVLFGSQKGTSARFAQHLAEQAAAQGMQLTVLDLGGFEVEQLWKEQLVIVVTSTYEDGMPPQSARY